MCLHCRCPSSVNGTFAASFCPSWVRGHSLTSLQECRAIIEPNVSCRDKNGATLGSPLDPALVGHGYLLVLVFPGVDMTQGYWRLGHHQFPGVWSYRAEF